MQKVSKQSLAMIALSILLAISIALTFTFAALQDSQTATGTITFSGSGSLTFTLDGAMGSGTANGSISFKLDETNFTISNDGKTATLTSGLSTGKVVFTNESKRTMYAKVSAELIGADASALTLGDQIIVKKISSNEEKLWNDGVVSFESVVPVTTTISAANTEGDLATLLGTGKTVKLQITAEYRYSEAY